MNHMSIGAFIFLLVALSALFLVGLYQLEIAKKKEIEDSRRPPRFPVWAIVVVYDFSCDRLYHSWEGLEVDPDNYSWSFGGKTYIIGRGAPFVLADGRWLGIIVLDRRKAIVGYINEDGPLLEDLAADLAKQAAAENCCTPKGRLSVYQDLLMLD